LKKQFKPIFNIEILESGKKLVWADISINNLLERSMLIK